MYLDVLATDEFLTVNKKLAKMFNINTAVYLTEILNIYKKAVKKEKITESGFMTLDRNYIYEQTTIAIKDQFVCDKLLSNYGILCVDQEDTSKIALDTRLLLSMLIGIDEEDIDSMRKIVKNMTKNIKVQKSGSAFGMEKIKAGIQEENAALKMAYCDWVDTIYATKGKLTKVIFDLFKEAIDSYTSDEKVKLIIIKYATSNCYREASWAINGYEKNLKLLNNSHVNQQKNNTGIMENTSF